MTSLPIPAMVTIYEFLDPTALARMACVSRAWRDLVYRNDPWQHFEFVLRPEAAASDIFVQDGEIPCDAHHIGAPTVYCFQAWASQPHLCGLPSAVVQTADPKKYMERLYAFWKRAGRPCMHVGHHRPHSVTRCVGLWKTLSPRDKKRFIYRVTAQFSTKDSSAYEAWLMSQRARLSTPRIMMSKPADLTAAQKDDPFLVIRHKAAMMSYDREQFLASRRAALVQTLDASRTALARRGKLYFEKHRTPAEMDVLWDAAAFSTTAAPMAPSDPPLSVPVVPTE